MYAETTSRHRGRVNLLTVTTTAGGILLLASFILGGWRWLVFVPREAEFRDDEPRVELILQVKTDRVVLSESEAGMDPAQVVASVRDAIRRRLRQIGVAKWNVTRRPGDPTDRLLVQVAARAGTDPARVEALVVSNSALALHLVESGPSPSKEALIQKVGGSLPPDTMVLTGTDRDVARATATSFYLVRATPVITGRDIAKARPSLDSRNLPAVSVSMTKQGAERLARATAANVGRQLAIVLDNVVTSAPRIDGVVTDQAQIAGDFTQADVTDLALVLSAGPFAAPVVVLERHTVGTTGTR